MHMESWNTLSLPKDLEGLGIYSVKHRNQAILAKLYWRLANDEESPQAKILAAKYLAPSRTSEKGRKLPCSRIWAACKKGGPVYVKGLKWAVNGDSIKMWKELQLRYGMLRDLIEGPLTREEDQLTVKQCFDANHMWNPQTISFELPDNFLITIKVTPSLMSNIQKTLSYGLSSKMAAFL